LVDRSKVQEIKFSNYRNFSNLFRLKKDPSRFSTNYSNQSQKQYQEIDEFWVTLSQLVAIHLFGNELNQHGRILLNELSGERGNQITISYLRLLVAAIRFE